MDNPHDVYRKHGTASLQMIEERIKDALEDGDEARALELALLLIEVENAAGSDHVI